MSYIIVDKISKAYKVYTSKWHRLAEWVLPFGRDRHVKKWILKDINFVVQPGEAVALVGMNGAGKSTLLKLITGTAAPTHGTVQIDGTVAALLELGMGFHADFTGRQNVFMAGQLLGYSVSELEELMPDIESFAEIGSYIDEPIRMYSSGMQMRLAFSVATAKRPDILIVDEALSVGDAYFQHKSFDRIKKYREQGTTLLLVSHDRGAVQAICDRALLLSNGQVVKEGDPESVMDFYNAMLADKQDQKIEQTVRPDGRVETKSGTGGAEVTDVSIFSLSGENLEVVDVGQEVILRISLKTNQNIEKLVLGYGIKDRLGHVIFGINTHLTDQVVTDVVAGSEYQFNINFPVNLGPGNYSIQTAITSSETHLENNYEWKDFALVFDVVNMSRDQFVGCAWIPPHIEIEKC